eukprot:2275674-Pleurochrysis_carterae.AAC.1
MLLRRLAAPSCASRRQRGPPAAANRCPQIPRVSAPASTPRTPLSPSLPDRAVAPCAAQRAGLPARGN